MNNAPPNSPPTQQKLTPMTSHLAAPLRNHPQFYDHLHNQFGGGRSTRHLQLTDSLHDRLIAQLLDPLTNQLDHQLTNQLDGQLYARTSKEPQ